LLFAPQLKQKLGVCARGVDCGENSFAGNDIIFVATKSRGVDTH
jgi:hypothetical protein